MTQSLGALPIGTIVDNYRIDRILGQGGFGITYLAHHIHLNSRVAIKESFISALSIRNTNRITVHPNPDGKSAFEKATNRFLDEAKRVYDLEHPNIIKVSNFFRTNNTAYMVLEYIDGITLEDWLNEIERPPTRKEIKNITVPLLDALEYMHSQKMLHRDIAPDNIIIRPDNGPCLIDFGSARYFTARNSHLLTAIAKPGYSPPEQWVSKSGAHGPWSDIYAFGATLYRAISGENPSCATVRTVSIGEERTDSLLPASSLAPHDIYQQPFLDAIDNALMLRRADRPRSIDAWRKQLFAKHDDGQKAGFQTESTQSDEAAPDESTLTDTLPPGIIVDRYKIEKVLGRGGFGITYLARHIELGTKVALKESYPTAVSGRDTTTSRIYPIQRKEFEKITKWFKGEADTLRRFNHPNIVKVTDFLHANDTAYMAMEFIEGCTFEEWLNKINRPPTQGELGKITELLLNALGQVHKEILHHDITPDNIIIRPDGTPCLIDFGSARFFTAGQSDLLFANDYFPPERWVRDAGLHGPWSDIYSLGATLYRAISSENPSCATVRTASIEEEKVDSLLPASSMAPHNMYQQNFLDAIDNALVLRRADRPQSVGAWRKQLFANHDDGQKAGFQTESVYSYKAVHDDDALTDTLSSGTIVDRYKIEKVLGRGGFGITYLARHIELGTKVALKESYPTAVSGRDTTTSRIYPIQRKEFEKITKWFKGEADTLRRFNHPNIVKVTDFFHANDTAYMAMEFIEGCTFEEWLKRLNRPPTQEELDKITEPLLGALEQVHKEILHRDIAPDNIIIRPDGTPCLIDFGSARFFTAGQSNLLSVIVKQGYSPPEQIVKYSKAHGPWSDIYSFGATLYRAVTGNVPLGAQDRSDEDGDSLVPAVEAAPKGMYRREFLQAIDNSLKLVRTQRAQTVGEWNKSLYKQHDYTKAKGFVESTTNQVLKEQVAWSLLGVFSGSTIYFLYETSFPIVALLISIIIFIRYFMREGWGNIFLVVLLVSMSSVISIFTFNFFSFVMDPISTEIAFDEAETKDFIFSLTPFSLPVIIFITILSYRNTRSFFRIKYFNPSFVLAVISILLYVFLGSGIDPLELKRKGVLYFSLCFSSLWVYVVLFLKKTYLYNKER